MWAPENLINWRISLPPIESVVNMLHLDHLNLMDNNLEFTKLNIWYLIFDIWRISLPPIESVVNILNSDLLELDGQHSQIYRIEYLGEIWWFFASSIRCPSIESGCGQDKHNSSFLPSPPFALSFSIVQNISTIIFKFVTISSLAIFMKLAKIRAMKVIIFHIESPHPPPSSAYYQFR